jgi:hypothetical protein
LLETENAPVEIDCLVVLMRSTASFLLIPLHPLVLCDFL